MVLGDIIAQPLRNSQIQLSRTTIIYSSSLSPNQSCKKDQNYMWKYIHSVNFNLHLNLQYTIAFFQVMWVTKQNGHLQTKKQAFTRHWSCRHLDLGFPSLQNYEKGMFVISTTHSMVFVVAAQAKTMMMNFSPLLRKYNLTCCFQPERVRVPSLLSQENLFKPKVKSGQGLWCSA